MLEKLSENNKNKALALILINRNISTEVPEKEVSKLKN